MKKLLLATLIATSALSAQANSPFTGWYVGGEIVSSKHTFKIYSDETTGKNGTGFAILGGYGFEFGENFVGLAEAKLKFGGSKSTAKYETRSYFGYHSEDKTATEENYQLSLAYLQGYRIDNFLPYIKISANTASYDINSTFADNGGIEGETAFGAGIGAGIKYAINDNLTAGIEYHHIFFRDLNGDIKLPTSNIGLNISYGF